MNQETWRLIIVEDPTGRERSPGELPKRPGEEIDTKAELRQFLWFCRITPNEFLGTPKEASETKQVRLQVNITGSLASTLNLHSRESAQNLAKFAFWFGKTQLEKQMENGNVPEKVTLEMDTSNSPTHCPVNLALVREPILGAEFELEVKKRIGF